MVVRTGAERLLRDSNLIPGSRWGLVTNYTAVTTDLELTAVALHRSTGKVAAVLGPEHGLRGTAQAGFAEKSDVEPTTGLPLVDTYGMEDDDLDAAIAALNLDALVADIQDVGVRFYTYAWTVVDCMRSAARLGIPFFVLDRPNPLSGAVTEGPGLSADFRSFVGRINVPIRHGLTLGELAREAALQDSAEGAQTPLPTVVEMEGWDRSMYWEDTGLPWVMPSPNLPTVTTALLYPGTCLFEGTNMSEGRGTARPFELVGAPWIEDSYAKALNDLNLPGVRFRSAWFNPTFSKHQGEVLGGVQAHVSDRELFQPVLTGVSMLQVAQSLSSEEFSWRLPDWEADQNSRAFVDLLWGSSVLRENLDKGLSPAQITALSPEADKPLAKLLY